MTEHNSTRRRSTPRFLLGLLIGAIVGAGGSMFWQRVTNPFRHRYVTVKDIALVRSPDTRVGVIPSGSEVVTLLPLDFHGDDYGSDAWIRVGINITSLGKQNLSTFESISKQPAGVPDLWLRELKVSE